MQRSSNCILPEPYPKISFDFKNVCNYCNNYKEFVPAGEDKLKAVIERKKSQNSKYDVIVALIAGRDSTYTLRYCVKKLNLKVLAYTVNNGFIPPILGKI